MAESDDIHVQAAAYVLNALDDEERRIFEAHLGRCTVCEEELESLRGAAAALAYAAEGPPAPAALRERVIDAVRAERPTALVVPLRRRLALPAVAAVAAAAAAVAVGLGLWAASLSRSLEEERASRGDVAALLAGVARGELARLPLRGVEGAVFVRPSGGAVLVVSNLPRAPRGRTYEAWVVEGRAARAAGLFAGGGQAVVPLLRRVSPGARVGVTLERRGGALRPTGRMLFQARRGA